MQALNAVKMSQREITHKQHEVELQFFGNALPNTCIAKSKHTKFQIIPP